MSTNDSGSATFLPLDDLDSIDTNELFSFILEEAKSPTSDDSHPTNNLASAFDIPSEPKSQDTPSPDLDIPLDILDLLNYSNSSQQLSNSSSSFTHPSLQSNLTMDGGSPYYSEGDEEGDLYCSGDEEYVERAVPSRRRGRGSFSTNPPLCLHNEDLARGKPVS